MRDTLRYQEIGSSRKYQQPEPKSTTFIIDLKSATPFPKCYLHKEKWTFDS